jgi:hypothetical protein
VQINDLTYLRALEVGRDNRCLIDFSEVLVGTCCHILEVFQLLSSTDDRCHLFVGILLALKNSGSSFGVIAFDRLFIPKVLFHLIENLELHITIKHPFEGRYGNILKCSL